MCQAGISSFFSFYFMFSPLERFEVLKTYLPEVRGNGYFSPCSSSTKIGPEEKYLISLSRIAIFLLKGSFERKNLFFHEKRLQHRKILY